MIDIDYFRTIQNQKGLDSMNAAVIAEGQMQLRDELRTSVHYMVGTRNGIEQQFIVTPSEAYHKYEIEALPGESLFVGDEIEVAGEHWIVVKTRPASPFQTIGLMWLCNYKFRWQNFSSEIIERWGVLDSGVYSTTRDGNASMMTPDKQFKIYFPKDEDTKKLFIDKRLAVEVIYDQHGEEILNVYRITGYDSVSSSYGQNGHLLVLNARSEDYVSSRDSIQEMICDYIAPGEEYVPPEAYSPDYVVDGPARLRIGTTRTYTANFDVASWELDPDLQSMTLKVNGNSAVLTAALNDALVGEDVSVRAKDGNGYAATLVVEVID